MSLTDRDKQVARYVLAFLRAEDEGRRVPAHTPGLLTAEELRELRVIIRRSNARDERLGR